LKRKRVFGIFKDMSYIVCHYHEIALKGKNRKFFEEKLIDNIKNLALKSGDFEFIKRISGRIIVKLTKEGIQGQKEISNNLKNIFGIAYFVFALDTEPKIKLIQEKALDLFKNKKFKTFRITTQRSEKDFPLTSQQINEKVGEYILKKLKTKNKNLKVNLEKPGATCFIEIVDKYAFLYLEKIQGPGGLPVGTGGKAVVLLSGGIDSPVASFCAMKRGLKVIFIHFHAYPYTSQASIEKTKKIAGILSKYQGKSKLYLVPFGEIQKEILIKTSARLRVVLYRRLMFRIAEIIAKEEWAGAIITGESIGQVASQTLENIRAIEESVDLLVLRPLITEDKEEIIGKAREIGTFEISILPDEDCCSRFLPAHPATKANLNEVKREEKKLNINKLIKEAVHKASLVQI